MSADRRVRVARAHRPEPPDAPLPSRFNQKVESEFRAWFYASRVQRAATSLGLAQLLVFASVGIDLIAAGEAPQRWAALVKLALISPLLLATQWISRHPRRRDLFPHFMCASIIAAGAAFSLVTIGGDGVGVALRYDALVLVTVFAYFLGGLASVMACVTGLALLGIYVFLSTTQDLALSQVAYEGLFLLAVNAIGMLSAHVTEQSVREAFWRFQTMTQLSELDPLTHLANRRGFDRLYGELWERAQHEGRTLALVFVDVDHFKGVNDRHGHDAGDQALKAVAAVLDAQTGPPPELCARLGGDELVAVWYDIEPARAEAIAARIPRAVEALKVTNEGSPRGVLTVSVGLSLCRPGPTTLAGDCLRLADAALYEAKQSGRNRFAVA